jgi:polyisoprenoid-binding protein YceI
MHLIQKPATLIGAAMNNRRRFLLSAFAVVALLVSGFAAPVADTPGQEMTVELDPEQTTVAFTLGDVLHTVHGSFKLKSGTIHFNPTSGAASGLVVVDVTSGDTGNKSRDRKMHKEILESAKYPEATFTPNKVSGQFNPQGASTMEVSGIFRLHGGDHPVVMTFPISVNGSTMTMTTHMVIPYVKWGLKNPSTFILRVSDKLNLDINSTGHMVATQASVAK